MQTPAVESSVEHTSIGRIVVPPNVPRGFRLFYTTIDFDGRIDERIRDFVKPAPLSSCHQVHGPKVCKAPVNELECDALWSDQKNTALAIKVADCLPVSIIDPKNSVIANIHSGWRGAVRRITSETIDAIEQSTKFESRDAHAYLGPSIRVCCFEVGEEVAAQFDESFIDRAHEKPHVDLIAMTIGILRSRGFRDDRIHDSRACTRCDGSIFHSYRRDSKGGGRNLALAAH